MKEEPMNPMKKLIFWFDLLGSMLGLLTAIAAPFVMRPLLNAIVWTVVVGFYSVRKLIELSKPQLP